MASLTRCLLRTSLVLLCLFTAESMIIPNFGAIMGLLGGTSVSVLCLIMPSVLYLCINNKQGDWPARYARSCSSSYVTTTASFREVRWWEKALCGILIAMGITGGIATTISSLHELSSSSTFVPPCYVN